MKTFKLLLLAMLLLPLAYGVVYSLTDGSGSCKFPVLIAVDVVLVATLALLTFVGYKTFSRPQETGWHLCLIMVYGAVTALPVYGVFMLATKSTAQGGFAIIATAYVFVWFANISFYLRQKFRPVQS